MDSWTGARTRGSNFFKIRVIRKGIVNTMGDKDSWHIGGQGFPGILVPTPQESLSPTVFISVENFIFATYGWMKLIVMLTTKPMEVRMDMRGLYWVIQISCKRR